MPWVDYFLDKKRFLLDILILLNFSETRGHTLGVVFGCMGIGVICDQLAVFGLAGRYHRRALAGAEAGDDPRAVGHAHLGLCLHESYLGSLEAAIEECRRAATPYRETGELRGWGTVTTMIGIMLFLRGEIAGALECSAQLIEMGHDSGDPMLRAWGLFVRGRVLCQTGELEEAARGLQHAIALHNAMLDYQGMADVNGLLGQCYLRQGRVLEAMKVLEESEGIITSHGIGGHQVTVPRNALTESYLAAAEQAEGLERSVLLQKARRASRASLRQGKIFRGGLPHAMRLEGTRAWLTGNRRAAQTWWERSRALAEQLGIPYEIAMSGVEMARRAGEQRYLDRAQCLLEEVGAVPDLVAARALAASGSEP
jgi:tetratricopeptide (TPR) repeat protein